MGTAEALTLGVATAAWGTLAAGALAHLSNPAHLRSLLTRHFGDGARPQVVSTAVIAVEVGLTLGTFMAYFFGWTALLAIVAVVGAATGVAFVIWVGRLVVNDSGLPCACSFSSAPPTWWSVGRAAVVTGFAAFASAPTVGVVGTAAALATFVAGLAVGIAVYTLPEALAWPRPAQLLRTAASESSSSGSPA